MTESVLFSEDSNNEFQFDKDYYEETIFEKISAQNLRLNDVEFYNCVFNGTLFVNGLLNSCRFEKCSFKNSDLSVAEITNSTFLDVKFENCKLIGIDWTKICQPVKVDFYSCKINDSVFTGMDLRSMEIISCEARGLALEKANLSKARLTDTDLLNTTFSSTNLSNADFRNAKNYRIDPTKNNIRKAKFSLPEAISLLDQWDIDIE